MKPLNDTQDNAHIHLGFYFEYANRKSAKKTNLVRKSIRYIANKLPFTIVFRIERKRTKTTNNDDGDAHLFV